MAIHICRDFQTVPTSFPSCSMYLTSIFLFGTLGYTQVGQTNFNVSGSFLVGSGVSASINMGAGNEYAVAIPTGSYLVSAADINRILVLRSNANPRFNSGLFRISNVNTGSNWAIVDYRSGDFPPAETGSLGWNFFINENLLGAPTFTTGSPPSPATGYRSRGALFAGKRVILQSPHSSSWQVRFCYESSADRTNHASQVTCAPGMNGDALGDFITGSYDTSAPNGEHLHGPLWFNVSNASYIGTTCGIEPTRGGSNTDISPAQCRFYAWGDDVSGSMIGVHRNVTSLADGWFSFGMTEEDDGLPPKTAQRLFTLGHVSSDQGITWNSGPAVGFGAGLVGMSFGLINKPVSARLATYCWLGQQADFSVSPRREVNAVDNVILGATEAIPVEVYAGTFETGDQLQNWPSSAVLDYDPRRIGVFPMARLGRANFILWSVSTDVSRAWFHTKDGVFFPWAGPAALP